MRHKNLPNLLFTQVIVPLFLLLIYSFSSSLLLSYFFDGGVNFVFVDRLWKYLFLLLVSVSIIFLSLFINNKKKHKIFSREVEKISTGDLIILLLPLSLIIQYILNNQDTLSVFDAFIVLIFFVIVFSIFIFLIPLLIGKISKTHTLMMVGLALITTIISMPILTQGFHWIDKGSLKIQLLFLMGIFIISYFSYKIDKRVLYVLAIVFFLSNTITQLIPDDNSENDLIGEFSENDLLLSIENKDPVLYPNIYLLVYESYAQQEALLSYGIDNSSQLDFLRNAGFSIYPGIYSTGADTVSSMSNVFNISKADYGNWRRGISGDGVVQNILKRIGYKTYGVFNSGYEFQNIGSSYDVSVPESSSPPYLQLISAILFGKFRFDFDLDTILYEDFVEIKREILDDVRNNRGFIYAHSPYPGHSQNSGVCKLDETDIYKDGLFKANVEMRKDVDLIRETDPNSIVVISGDHGPYLTKNCTVTGYDYDISEISRLDVQDRLGVFLAIRWPEDNFLVYDEIEILQDIFPAIFSYLYQDETVLKSKMYPLVSPSHKISGVSVDNGIIIGGIDDGKPLYIMQE